MGNYSDLNGHLIVVVKLPAINYAFNNDTSNPLIYPMKTAGKLRKKNSIQLHCDWMAILLIINFVVFRIRGSHTNSVGWVSHHNSIHPNTRIEFGSFEMPQTNAAVCSINFGIYLAQENIPFDFVIAVGLGKSFNNRFQRLHIFLGTFE